MMALLLLFDLLPMWACSMRSPMMVSVMMMNLNSLVVVMLMIEEEEEADDDDDVVVDDYDDDDAFDCLPTLPLLLPLPLRSC